MKIHARLGDYVCPPSTTTTLYNYFNGIKEIDFLQAGTHPYCPPEHQYFRLRFDPSNPTGKIKLGKYRHYKGGEYEVIGIAKDSETLSEMVVYRALYGDGELWVRSAEMFGETVTREGKTFPRFEYIGE